MNIVTFRTPLMVASVLAALLVLSCSKKDDLPPIEPPTPTPPAIQRTISLYVDKEPLSTKLSFTKQDTTLEVLVECDSAWTVEIEEQKWAKVSSDRSKNSFTLNIPTENFDAASRETVITLHSGSAQFALTVNQAGTNSSAAVSDSLVLVKLYKSLDGPYWRSMNKDVAWDLHQPISSWHGVRLNADNRVEYLVLPDVGLDGEIPSQIGLLSELKVLDFNDNAIKGAIPVEVGALSKLEKLYLNNNKFTGELPEAISKLAHLQELLAQGNRLKVFPTTICSIGTLTHIELQNNEISELPGELISLSKLESIYLNDNLLTSLPAGLDKMPALVYLHAQNNLIRSLPAELGLLTNLLSLNLSNNKIEGEIPAAITNLTKLKYLYLASNNISGAIPAGTEKMAALEVIELDGNSLSGTMPDWGLNPNINRIRMSENNLQGDISNYFANCPLLQEVILSNNKLSGAIPEGLADIDKAPELTFLALYNNNLTGTVPAKFAEQLDKWRPSFNKKGFLLFGNRLGGEIPEEIYNTGYGNVHTLFNFATNVYPQQPGYNFTNSK